MLTSYSTIERALVALSLDLDVRIYRRDDGAIQVRGRGDGVRLEVPYEHLLTMRDPADLPELIARGVSVARSRGCPPFVFVAETKECAACRPPSTRS